MKTLHRWMFLIFSIIILLQFCVLIFTSKVYFPGECTVSMPPVFTIDLVLWNTDETLKDEEFDGGLIVMKDIQLRAIESLNQQSKVYKDPTKSKDGDTNVSDILISAYQRSGSSFTGQLLAYSRDIFYWYEPLWNYGIDDVYWGRDFICTGTASLCGVARNYSSRNINRMENTMYNIYTCNFKDLEDAVADKMTPIFSGKVWEPYITCRASNRSKTTCLSRMQEVCRASKQRSTKVLRLTVDNLEFLLEHLPSLKAIHLFRDPRAIINSRITTKNYTLHRKVNETTESFHRRVYVEARDLCMRMEYDIRAGEILKRKYPRRFAFVMYEDLNSDLRLKSEILFSFFGIDKSMLDKKLSNVTDALPNQHTVEKKYGEYTNWWRLQMNYDVIKVIDNACRNVTHILGYKVFSSKDELKNLSIKAYLFSNELLLENLHKSAFYNFPEVTDEIDS